MNPRLLALLMRRFQKPAGEDGSVVDRGDNFTPTDDATDAAARAVADAAALAAKEALDKTEVDPKTVDPKAKTIAGEGEDDETDEEKAEREAAELKAVEDVKKGDTRGKRIPLDRHEAVLKKERELRADLERQVADMKKGAVVTATNEDIAKLEDATVVLETAYNKALAEGELKDAGELMKKIRHNERLIGDQRGELRSQVAEARAYERVRFDNTVERLSAAYPVLDPEHADHDQAQVNDVLELKDAYQLKGYSPSDALQKAAKTILGAATAKQERAVDTDVKVAAADVAKAAADARKKEAVARNVAIAGKLPADLSKVGLDSDKAGGSLTARDAVKLSHEDFGKLDEKTLAKMRGDVVT